MRIYFVIIVSVLLVGILANSTSAVESNKQSKVEQTIDGAMQLFEAQRKMRLAAAARAMAQVIPYLFQGPMGVDSKQELFKRIEEVEAASRHAAAVAYMHRDLSASLVRMLTDQGVGKDAAKIRVARVIAELKPEKMEAEYEMQYLVTTALNRVYEYLDNHWGEWELHGRRVTFSDEKLNIPYQTLIDRLGETVDRLGETVDRMDASQNSKPDTGTTAPLSCKLATRQLSEGAVEAIVTVTNHTGKAVTILKPCVGTVTWILPDNQTIGAHPGRPPEEMLLDAGESINYSDSLDLPLNHSSLSAKIDLGRKFGALPCN